MSAPTHSTSRRDALRLGAGLVAGSSLAGCVVVVKDGPPPSARPASRDEHGEPATAPQADDLFPQLSDQRHTVEPISPAERAARRERLGRLLQLAGVDAYFCEGGPTMSYLSGVSWGHSERVFGLMVFADGSHAWVSPAFEASTSSSRRTASGAWRSTRTRAFWSTTSCAGRTFRPSAS